MRVGTESIYVQIDIHAPLERIWELTQTPELHRRWDLRFTDIQYLPRPDPGQPQKFLYLTRIKFAPTDKGKTAPIRRLANLLCIRGEGETVGCRDGPTEERSSALKFWSDDRKSLIRTGSGYWKYIPMEGPVPRVRFLTRYDYDVRFGAAGRLFDRLVFRPLLGWATAWSFDRLRLWIERGIEPEAAMQRSLIHAFSRLTLSFVWIYQGLVPKLIFHHPDELAMLHDVGFGAASVMAACVAAGAAEIAFGLFILLSWRSRWPLRLTMWLMPIMAVCVAISSPRMLIGAFNAMALNAAVFALAGIALLSDGDLPSARRCLRRPSTGGAQ
jgi:hypothetical protein